MSAEKRSAGVDRQVQEVVDRQAGVRREPISHPTREVFDRELTEVKENVLRMGMHVESAIRAAIDALVRHDADAALEVITADRLLNEMQRKVTSMITAAIATQQPVARDLRFLLTLDHVSYELERMGDHAASVAKQVRKLADEPPLEASIELRAIGELCADLVRGVLRALVDIDTAAARDVAGRDDEVDRRYRRFVDEVVELMRAGPANVSRGTWLLFAAYYLERIGDRATNIAEDVVFLATGEIEDLNP
ncbi:MAG TPA: phosphate signaling complex protein PhoU [Candidatus Limnocylindrales bacterium]